MGPQGQTGATGEQGPKGDTGPKGAKGDTGATGAQGPKGDTGATGATGPIGQTGPKGDTGAVGPAGPAGGINNTTIVTGASVSTAGNPAAGALTGVATVSCATGKAVGGGASVTQGSGAKGAVATSFPTANGWSASAIVTVAGGGSISITPYVICAS